MFTSGVLQIFKVLRNYFLFSLPLEVRQAGFAPPIKSAEEQYEEKKGAEVQKGAEPGQVSAHQRKILH